jgi:hypothetical protein
MRRYGGPDVQGLTSTGNWRDPRSAARWAHVVAREEWEVTQKWPLLCSAILRRVVGSDESRKS